MLFVCQWDLVLCLEKGKKEKKRVVTLLLLLLLLLIFFSSLQKKKKKRTEENQQVFFFLSKQVKNLYWVFCTDDQIIFDSRRFDQ
jgi:hypothetical protein